jgi:acyl-coenzyme A synthetase/AMP-(fatty) acid ligase
MSGEGKRDLPAFLIYTSGSTGTPKGVICPHRQVLFATRAINSVLRNTPNDVILCGLPLSFDYGLYQIFLSFDSGALLVLEPSFQNPLVIPGLLQRWGVTGFPGVPSLFASLLRSGFLARMKFEKLRYLTSTGDVFPEAQMAELESVLPGVYVIPMYGLTECKRVCMWQLGELPRREGSVGKPLSGTSAEVVDEELNIVPAGQVGELVVRGPHLTDGYWNDPQYTADRFRKQKNGDFLLRTGDLFRKDADGYLYFIGRMTGLIKSHGERISPVELETYLASIKYVVEACAVGVPDTEAGHVLCAFVVASPGNLGSDVVQLKCRQNLRSVLCPKYVFVENNALPRNQNGKIDRAGLRRKAVSLLNLMEGPGQQAIGSDEHDPQFPAT